MKFKSLIISVLGLFIFSFQILKPVKWTFSPSKKGAKVGETIELVFKGKIDPGWYLYSSDLKVDGPMPTEIEFDQNGSFQLVGKLMPINANTPVVIISVAPLISQIKRNETTTSVNQNAI